MTFGAHGGHRDGLATSNSVSWRGFGNTSMVEILKFARPETAFDPESIQVLASALDEAWSRIEQSGSQFARPAYSRVMREVIAKRMIEIAQQGVRDQQILVDDAMRFLAANYRDVGKQPA